MFGSFLTDRFWNDPFDVDDDYETGLFGRNDYRGRPQQQQQQQRRGGQRRLEGGRNDRQLANQPRQLTPSSDLWNTMTAWQPRCDVRETDKEISLIAELPGIRKEDISVSLDNGLLTVSGERRSERTEGGDNERWHHVERSFGRFSRTMRVPEHVTEDDIRATYDNGVLTVSFPNRQAEKRPAARRISIGSSQPMMTGATSGGMGATSGMGMDMNLNKQQQTFGTAQTGQQTTQTH